MGAQAYETLDASTTPPASPRPMMTLAESPRTAFPHGLILYPACPVGGARLTSTRRGQRALQKSGSIGSVAEVPRRRVLEVGSPGRLPVCCRAANTSGATGGPPPRLSPWYPLESEEKGALRKQGQLCLRRWRMRHSRRRKGAGGMGQGRCTGEWQATALAGRGLTGGVQGRYMVAMTPWGQSSDVELHDV